MDLSLRVLAVLLALGAFGGNALAQDTKLLDVFPNVKGSPTVVLVSEAKVSQEFGALSIGEGLPVRQYRFSAKGQLLEFVEFEGSNPVSYTKYTYDSLGRLLAVQARTADGQLATAYTYGTAGDTFQSITRDKGNRVTGRTSVQVSSSAGGLEVLTRRYSAEDALTGADRVVKDQKGRTIRETWYEASGAVNSLLTVSFSSNERVTQYFGTDGDLFSRYSEKLDVAGNTISASYEMPTLDKLISRASKSRSEYTYDKIGNWVRLIEYDIPDRFGGLIPEPSSCTYRAFTYARSPAVEAPSIEPKTLYPRSELSVQPPPTPQIEQAAATPRMSASETSDPFDDKRTVTFVVDSDTGKGALGGTVYLIIRAREDQPPELFINWNSYLGDSASVTTRIDSDPAESSQWTLSTDSKASFYPGDTSSLLTRLATAKKLVARTVPYNESPITVEFDVTGFGPLAKPYEWIVPPSGSP